MRKAKDGALSLPLVGRVNFAKRLRRATLPTRGRDKKNEFVNG
jgi:hypothetical protein